MVKKNGFLIFLAFLVIGCGFDIPKDNVYWALEDSSPYVEATEIFEGIYGKCNKRIFVHPMPTWFVCPLSGAECAGCVGINDDSCIIYVGILKGTKNAECGNVGTYLHELYHCCTPDFNEGPWVEEIESLSEEICLKNKIKSE